MRVKANSELSDNVPVTKGIRQRDSLSPILFSVVTDDIIKEIKHMRGYRTVSYTHLDVYKRQLKMRGTVS